MPALGALMLGLLAPLYQLILALAAKAWGIKLAALTALAAAYVATVAIFSAVLAPWWIAISQTGFGLLLGLLFPPVAGTVLGSLVTLWGAVLGWRLAQRLLRASAG